MVITSFSFLQVLSPFYTYPTVHRGVVVRVLASQTRDAGFDSRPG